MATATRSIGRPWLLRVTPQMVILFLVASVAAAWTVREADGMWEMPGTMGYSFAGFLGMWGLMMAAMMLPSVAPFASMYSRLVQANRWPRLLLFAAGYVAIWTVIGIPAYAVASFAGEIAGDGTGTALAVAIFAACGIYQLTPLKLQCLSHCRSPMGHLLHYSGFQGPLRDLRVGFSHGFYCAACCWGLMAVLVAVGIMNVPAMIILAAIVALEKVWARGEIFSRAVGAGALAAAVAVIWAPGLAPGLTNEPMDMSMMAMEGSMSDGSGSSMGGDMEMSE